MADIFDEVFADEPNETKATAKGPKGSGKSITFAVAVCGDFDDDNAWLEAAEEYGLSGTRSVTSKDGRSRKQTTVPRKLENRIKLAKDVLGIKTETPKERKARLKAEAEEAKRKAAMSDTDTESDTETEESEEEVSAS